MSEREKKRKEYLEEKWKEASESASESASEDMDESGPLPSEVMDLGPTPEWEEESEETISDGSISGVEPE